MSKITKNRQESYAFRRNISPLSEQSETNTYAKNGV